MGIFGSTGVGKSTVAELICEIEYLNNRRKIIDLQNNKYLEVCSFVGPTRNRRFVSNLRKFTGGKIKPRGFPTEVYHPIVTALKSKFPEIIKLYTLPIDFFAYEEVLKVITNDTLGDAAYVSLTQEIEKLAKNDSLPALPTKILESLNRKILKTEGMGVPLYFFYDSSMSASSANRPILKVKDMGVFSSANYEHCLTDRRLVEIIRDHRTITGFSTRWIDQKHRKVKLAINLYLLMKIRDMAKRAGGGTIVYIREAREIFPNPRYSDKSLKVLGELAEDMIKDCRKAGIRLILDSQTPWDLPEGVLDQLSLKIIFRHDRRESEILDMYKGTSSLDRDRLKNIKKLKNYRFYISSANFPVGANSFSGIALDYKLSGHLEERQDELSTIRSSFPKANWYDTKEFVHSLKQDWLQTYQRHSLKFNRRYVEDNEKVTARSMGISASELRILRYLYLNRDKKHTLFKEVQNNIGAARRGPSSRCHRP
jgi:DNA helicase HerA-like ATPase